MENNTHPITVYLPTDTWKLLSELAKQDGRTVAWLAREIIKKKVEESNKNKRPPQ